MTVHLNVWDQWVECHATVRPCPRAIHLDVSLDEVKTYPSEVIRKLFSLEKAPVVLSTGVEQWSDENGQLHRERDLPAVIRPNGTKEWYKHGKRHRSNGPAIIDAKGEGRWYKNGVFCIVGGKRPVQENDSLEQLIALSPRRKREIADLRRRRGLPKP
jgi:hypothetical protein